MDEQKPVELWERCYIGSCKRHQDCMYKPCRAVKFGTARPQPAPDAGGLVERIARSTWEAIASTSPNPEYYDPWDKMKDSHPGKVHHRALASTAWQQAAAALTDLQAKLVYLAQAVVELSANVDDRDGLSSAAEIAVDMANTTLTRLGARHEP